jgi:tetratricopeptide (TPR) repeat protein
MSNPLHDTLVTLEAGGLLRALDDTGEAEYQFRHALTQEASYASLTKQRRRQLHLAIGRTFESLYPGRLPDLSDLLAYHFAMAGEAEPACRYALLASERALSTYAYGEAAAYLDRALEVVARQGRPELRFGLLEARGDVHTLLRQGSAALDRFVAAVDAWQAVPDGERMDVLRLHRKIVHIATEMKWSIEKGDFENLSRASEASRRALEAASLRLEDEPAHPETVRLRTVLSNAAWRMQTPPNWESALNHARAAVRVAEDLASPEDLAPALGALSSALFAFGQLRQSLDTALRRLELTRRPEFSDIRERLDSFRGAGSAHMYVGEYEEAISLLLEAEQLAVRVQAADQQFNALSLLTQCWLRLDRWDNLLAREADWEEIELRFPQERTGPVCFPLALRAVFHARRGDVSRARLLADRSMRIMVNTWGHANWLRNAHY